jgi:signal transduction histidine kinase
LGLTSEALAAQLLARALTSEVESGSIGGSQAPDDARPLVPRLVHELRTPVGSLMMLSEMLEAEVGDGGPRAAARNASQLRMLATDILAVLEEIAELSALERGAVLLHVEPVSVTGLLTQLERDHRTAASESGVVLEISVDPSAPESLDTDRERLQRLLNALLRGAIRAGVNERVEVRAGAHDTSQGRGLRVTFVDHGAPLPPGGERTAFQPFGLADARTRRTHGGTSLALPIAAAAARLLGGELGVRSDSKSTCFTLLLPSQPPRKGEHS